MGYIAPTTQGWTSQPFGTNPGGYNPAGGHTGEDIAIPIGTPLVAMADGVVVHVGYFDGAYSDNQWWIEPSFAGFVVTVDYGPYLSHYAHCSSSPVLSGKRVKQGDVVAYSGNTGTATSGPHCHWEVMPDGWDFQNGTYGRINPRTLLGSLSAQGGTITPLSEEDIMATLEELRAVIREEIAQTPKAWFKNKYGTDVQFESLLGAIDQNANNNNANAQAKLDRIIGEVVGLRAAVTELAKGSNVTAAQVDKSIKDALSGFSITLTADTVTK